MRSRMAILAALVILVLASLIGCSQGYLLQGEKAIEGRNFQQAIDYLETALKEKPFDAKVLRALGRAYYHKGDMVVAEEHLLEAQKVMPNDGVTALYLGMVSESKGDFGAAEGHYRNYLERNSKSESAEAIRGRLLYVQNENLRKQVAEAVKQEDAISEEAPSALTVGVLPFDTGADADETTRSLAAGLQTITWYDLASIPELNVVERLEFKYLIDELKLSEEGFSADNSAPRLGKLVRAGRLVNGRVDKVSADAVSLNSALVNTTDAQYVPTFGRDAKFKEVMKIQKEMVLAVLDSLGIELKGSRRQAFKKLQTENYDAFLAFCQGVELYDDGQYQKAKGMFDRAASIDPQFNLATSMGVNSSLIGSNSGSLDSFDEQAFTAVAVEPTTSFDAVNEVTDIVNPPIQDPRKQDQPQNTGTGSATVSGTIR